MIVVDASIIVPALADDGHDGVTARDRLAGERLAAPELIDLEVASVWRRLVASGHLTVRRARLALADLADVRIERAGHTPLLPRIWQLRSNVTTYDAAYIALAEALDALLLTADGRLANAPGMRCEVEVLGARS